MLGATAVGLVGQGQYGTIKGRLVWGGDQLPPVKVLAEKGKAAKDPEVCARNQPILSRELAVDRVNQIVVGDRLPGVGGGRWSNELELLAGDVFATSMDRSSKPDPCWT